MSNVIAVHETKSCGSETDTPSSAFGTFSPAEKRGGEGSRRYWLSPISLSV